jgi:hypothetical protein
MLLSSFSSTGWKYYNVLRLTSSALGDSAGRLEAAMIKSIYTTEIVDCIDLRKQ